MVNLFPLQLKEKIFRLIFQDFWLEFVNFYAERLIFLLFYDYWSTPFTPLKNLLSPNLGKSMSETCQDLERLSLNELVLTYLPFEIRKVSQFSILIDWWMKPNQDIPCKTKIYENSQCYQKNQNNDDNNNNSNNNYQCRLRWDKCNLSLLLRLFVMLDALSYRFHRVSVQNISVFKHERRILLKFIIHLTLQK